MQNVTVPTGLTDVPLDTVAVKVTTAGLVTAFEDSVNRVVVLTALTVKLNAGVEVLEVKLPSPLNTAVKLSVPTGRLVSVALAAAVVDVAELIPTVASAVLFPAT